MISETEIAQRVARGASLLDSKMPGWREKIDLETLDIGSALNCVLGQVYGDFFTGLKELDLKFDVFSYDCGFSYESFCGFSREPFCEFEFLNRQWKQVITSKPNMELAS